MRFRKLRIALSATCLTACVLLIVLWVRSYFWADAVPRLHIASAQGALYVRQSFQLQPGAKNETFRLGTITMPLDGQMIVRVGPPGLVVPFWIITLLTLGLGTVPWLRWRFSLRTLLMFTTLLAAMLGLIVFATQ